MGRGGGKENRNRKTRIKPHLSSIGSKFFEDDLQLFFGISEFCCEFDKPIVGKCELSAIVSQRVGWFTRQ